MRNKFSGLTKLHVSPYYGGCSLWTTLPEDVQKVENMNVFKHKVKEYPK